MAKKLRYLFFFTLTILLAGLGLYVFNSSMEPPKETEEEFSGAFEALGWLNAQRAYPNPELPERGYSGAFQQKQRMKRSRAKSASVNNAKWEPMGPHNVGGRTLFISVNPENPQTLYAGSATGGLWRSYSAGEGQEAWHYVSTGFPVLGVSSIAINPQDTSVIYIGTGEVYNYENTTGGRVLRPRRGSHGIGILKSENGGATWEKSLDWSYNQQRGIQMLRLDPSNPQRIWAATTEGIYISNNAGDSWTKSLDVIMGIDIAIHPTNTDTVLATMGNLNSAGNGIYRTTDAGANWTMITDGLPSQWYGKALMDVAQSSPNIVYASIGNGPDTFGGTFLCRSDDFGKTWSIRNTIDYASYQGWYSHFVRVNPDDPDDIILGGIDMWRSTDGGDTMQRISNWRAWDFYPPVGGPSSPSPYSHADHHQFANHPTSSDTIYFANDGGIFRSNNGGNSFVEINGGYQTTQFYNGISNSKVDSTFSIGGLQDNATAKFLGDKRWELEIGGDGAWTAIHPFDDNFVYASYYYLNILSSTDGGESWNSISPPDNGVSAFVSPFVLSPSDPDILYGGRSIIYKSQDRGNSWTVASPGELDGNPALGMDISEYDPDVVYVTTAPINGPAGIFRTRDGGESWIDITGNLPDRYPMDITVNPNNDEEVYVVFSGFGSSHAFKSTNSGDTWTDIGTGLPDVPTSAIAVDPQGADTLFIGNDLGVYHSVNGGNSWQYFSEGLPDAAMVTDLKISYSNRALRVATYGNGMYERSLEGQKGYSVPKDPKPPIQTVTLYQNYPNPFNPGTTIKYDLNEEQNVLLEVYDITGRKVRTLVNTAQSKGQYTVPFSGENLSSGIYFYRLKTKNQVISQKMTLIK